MSFERVSVQVHNNESDFFRLLWWVRRRTLIITILVVCVVSGSFSVYASLVTPRDPANDRRWIVYATSLFVPIFVAVVMYFALRSHARTAATSAELVTITLDKEGVAIEGTKASSTSSWNAFAKVVETPDDFVFYVQPKIFFGVPKRCFESDGQVEAVSAFVSSGFRNKAEASN